MDIISNIFQIITGTMSVIIALSVFLFSKKKHKQDAFYSLFPTILNRVKESIDNIQLSTTRLNGNKTSILITDNCNYSIFADSSVYKNFCQYYVEYSRVVNNKPYNGAKVANVWENYVSNLHNRAMFDSVFKNIYICIYNIDNAEISVSEKEKCVRLVADVLNSEQLFCYMINIVHNCKGYCSDDETTKMLLKYNFFRDLFNSEVYAKIENTIDVSIIRCFSLPQIKT